MNGALVRRGRDSRYATIDSCAIGSLPLRRARIATTLSISEREGLYRRLRLHLLARRRSQHDRQFGRHTHTGLVRTLDGTPSLLDRERMKVCRSLGSIEHFVRIGTRSADGFPAPRGKCIVGTGESLSPIACGAREESVDFHSAASSSRSPLPCRIKSRRPSRAGDAPRGVRTAPRNRSCLRTRLRHRASCSRAAKCWRRPARPCR